MNASVLSAINQASAATGVPVSILTAVANQESGGNPNAIGAAGEIGAFQLMPGTAASLGVDPTDVNENALGAALYLKQNYAQFGSWPAAVAAYNAGPGTVSNAIANYGSNYTAGLPPSTQNYQTNVLAAAGFAGTAAAPGGISTPPAGDAGGGYGDYTDTSAGNGGSVSNFFSSLSTGQQIGLAAVGVVGLWALWELV